MPPSEPNPKDEEEFQDEIERLIKSAHRKGVNVVGAWDINHAEDGLPSWTAEISSVGEEGGDGDEQKDE
ncbi:MAG: hypothetical protein SV760_07100 [Halobacteria archaeon]|nr:hypothetical protein [Halobacteria archaeon]